jgi:hypothetical protein
MVRGDGVGHGGAIEKSARGGADTLTIAMPSDSMLTLSTIATAKHGVAPTPVPASAALPLPYSDAFVGYENDTMPRYFSDQVRDRRARAARKRVL